MTVRYNFTTKNLGFHEVIKELLEKKLEKLRKLLKNYPEDAVFANVAFKKQLHRSTHEIFNTQIALHLPGDVLHADQNGFTLEESLIGAIEDIEDQVEDYKRAHNALR